MFLAPEHAGGLDASELRPPAPPEAEAAEAAPVCARRARHAEAQISADAGVARDARRPRERRGVHGGVGQGQGARLDAGQDRVVLVPWLGALHGPEAGMR